MACVLAKGNELKTLCGFLKEMARRRDNGLVTKSTVTCLIKSGEFPESEVYYTVKDAQGDDKNAKSVGRKHQISSFVGQKAMPNLMLSARTTRLVVTVRRATP
ncbi:hypothetical protein RJ641_029452 [Dillenia turbinata]|uniref:Uncharacterized protein n=1 Tax=Dillenia turbinata TaxID=194707 RepID=A0AAN8W1C9_9MAGN